MRLPRPIANATLFGGLLALCVGTALSASEGPSLSQGQLLYVPVYSHIYWGTKPRPFNLACTLSMRNTDPKVAITIASVDYYDSEGKRIKSFLEKPLRLPPLGTKEIYIHEKDTAGGSGANFLVRWTAEKPANEPLVECVMIGVEQNQGISFISSARVLTEASP